MTKPLSSRSSLQNYACIADPVTNKSNCIYLDNNNHIHDSVKKEEFKEQEFEELESN